MECKDYYRIQTYKNYQKIVFVPVDEVESVAEAKRIVADAIESYKLHFSEKDADSGEVLLGRCTIYDDKDVPCNILHKEKEDPVFVVINRSGKVSVREFKVIEDAIDFLRETYKTEVSNAEKDGYAVLSHMDDDGRRATVTYGDTAIELVIGASADT